MSRIAFLKMAVGCRSTGFSLWGFMHPKRKTHRLKPVLQKPIRLARNHRLRGERLRLQDFINEKKVREKCAQMDRSVQVIDQL